jgi:hypothetical protein
MSSLFASPKPVSGIDDCHFYHTMDIPGYGTVEGEWDLRSGAREYLGGVDLKGKRVLEVGTASGFLCFYMESQGAEVLAYDLSQSHDWDLVPYVQYDHEHDVLARKRHIHRINNAFWLGHKAFNSKAKMVYGTVSAIPEAIGLVDISTFGSVLLHIRDPFLALQNALRLTTETVIVTDVYAPGTQDTECLYFLPRFRETQPRDTWWNLPPTLIKSFIGVLGFEEAVVTYHEQKYRGRPHQLYTVVGRRTRRLTPKHGDTSGAQAREMRGQVP